MNNNFFTNELVSSSRIIYTPSPFASSSLLYLQETGTLQAQAYHRSERSGLNSYLFYIVLFGSGVVKGTGTEKSSEPAHTIDKGTCVFINCQDGYAQWPEPNDLWKLKWVHFNGVSMPEIYRKYLSRGGRMTFKPENFTEFESTLDEIYSIAGSDSYMRDMLINEKLAHLLTLIMNESWHPEETEDSEVRHDVAEIRSYINANYQSPMTLETIAQKFFISKNYLAHLFREQCGATINSYIQQVRVTEAKRLLRFTDKTIEEISEECGFNSKNYFSRVFKKLEDCNASEYRSQWRGK